MKRSRLRVEDAFAMAYFYLEDREQMKIMYERSEQGERVEIELLLEDGSEPQVVAGIPRQEAPPYTNPPYHMKMYIEGGI